MKRRLKEQQRAAKNADIQQALAPKQTRANEGQQQGPMPQIIRKAREYDSVTGKRLESSDLTQVFNVELKRARRDEHERQARIKYSEQPRNSQGKFTKIYPKP